MFNITNVIHNAAIVQRSTQYKVVLSTVLLLLSSQLMLSFMQVMLSMPSEYEYRMSFQTKTNGFN
jgi:hypothetical protein